MIWMKDSSVYSIQGGGDRQLFKLFTERSLRITKTNAMFGMVMPAGIYQDLGTKEIREDSNIDCIDFQNSTFSRISTPRKQQSKNDFSNKTLSSMTDL